MYEKSFTIEIITPGRVVFSGQVTSVSAPGVEGGFQILASHAPFMSALGVGRLTTKGTDGADTRYATAGGFLEVKDNRVVVLAEAVERSDEIDVRRAEAARDRATDRLRVPTKDIDIERARAALLRALNRLQVAGQP
ncbi:MAG: synthase epsilon subunit [Bacteroidetes bacterium]|nr:synthase epsilon subunit [Bacteroidota bacterium]